MRLEGQPHLAQMIEKILVDAAGEVPGENVAVEEVPLLAGRDACADPGARYDHALGGKRLHRFAQYRPRDAETQRQFRISGENAADRELARNDRLAELIHDLCMARPLRRAGYHGLKHALQPILPRKLLIVSVILAGDDQH